MKQIIREIIPVIIGILIALLINNWNEERKEKKYLNQIYSSIEKELEESNNDIIAKVPMQQVLVDSLRKYMNDEDVSIFEIIGKAGGINAPQIKNYSWKAIANSKIELIEFEKLSALSEIDESKKSFDLKQERTIDFVFENLKNTSKEKKEIFMLLTQEIISTEKYMQLEIEEFLKNGTTLNFKDDEQNADQ